MSVQAEIIFAHWKDHAQEDYAKSRFTKVVTKELLDNLMFLFKEKNIDMETAMMFERKSVEFLVTEEGRKGGKNKRTGKDYKDWEKNVKTYFKSAVGDHYDDSLSSPASIIRDPIIRDPITEFLVASPIVRAWVEKQFGSLNESILYETCRDSTALNLQMQDELFNSDWSQSGENIPDWAKKVLE